MTCASCGTEIADKALICYRCGRPTASPARTATRRRPRRASATAAGLALVVLLVAALYMGRAAGGETPAWLGWAVAAGAALVVAWRMRRR